MQIINTDVCETKVRYEIKDKEVECWGYGDTEVEAWEDLEESLWDFLFDMEERGEYVSDKFKSEVEILKKRVGADIMPRNEYIESLFSRIAKLENELWDAKQVS
jgi:hypothetical protein